MGKLSAALIASVVMMALVPAVIAEVNTTETVRTETRPMTVKYSSGKTEQYIVEWTGTLRNHEWESGGPSKPAEGHFVDDRQCHWELEPKITRKLYLVNEVGDHFAKEDLTTAYQVHFQNQGAGFMLVGLRSENCGDADARYRSDVNDGRKNIEAVFQSTVDSDLAKLISQVKAWKMVVKVTSQVTPKNVAGVSPKHK